MRRAAPLLALVLVTSCSGAAGSPAAPGSGAAPAAAPAGATASGPGGSGPAGPADLPAPTGFRVALEHEERPVAGPDGRELVAWESAWVLTWDPVPGAASYAVYFATNEGGGQRPRRTTEEPRLRLQAAAGTSPADRLETDRAAGLLFTSTQLLAAVSARAEGSEGPRSPWFPVGDVPPGGVPLATEVESAGH